MHRAEKVTKPMASAVVDRACFHTLGRCKLAERLSVGLAEVFAGSARWSAAAAPFAEVVPPVVDGTSPSALAVGAIHAAVSVSHGMFGARLLDTAAGTQRAGMSYSVTKLAIRAAALIGVAIWLMLTTHGLAVAAATAGLFVMGANDIAVIVRHRRHQPAK
jgi:hypothetical protein